MGLSAHSVVFLSGPNILDGHMTEGEGGWNEWDVSMRFLAWAAHFI